jgi:hypothetical protein
MSRAIRYVPFALLALSLPLSASAAHAQVPTAEARSFVGTWDVAFQGDQPVTVVLLISDIDGQLAATADMMETSNTVRTIRKQDAALVLAYNIQYQGTPVDVSITLTPGDEGVAARLSAAQGQYTVTGTATKR